MVKQEKKGEKQIVQDGRNQYTTSNNNFDY